MNPRLRVLVAFLLAWFAATPARALAPDLSLSQVQHTSWTAKDGAPLGIRRMAQTADGWLWLGSTSGLFRFDGQKFERYAPAQEPAFGTRRVSTLCAGAGGTLWVGLLDGGVARIEADGNLTVFTLPAGVSPGAVLTLTPGADGEMWAGLLSDVLRYDGHHWTRVGQDWNLPMQRFGGLHLDGNGAIWVVADGRMHRLDRGARTFMPVEVDVRHTTAIRRMDGASWLVSRERVDRLPGSEWRAPGGRVIPAVADAPAPGSSVVLDRHRNVWSAFCPAGLCRAALDQALAPERDSVALSPIEQFDARDGLSGNIGMTLLEDREGSLWMATQTGLDRFRDVPLVRPRLSGSATNFSVAAGGSAPPLVGGIEAEGNLLWRLTSTGPRPLAWPEGAGRFLTAYRDASGQDWVGSATGLWKMDGDTLRRVTPAGASGAFDTRRIEADAQALWVLFRREGLRRLWPDGQWDRPLDGPAEGSPLKGEQPQTFELDGRGALWLGLRNNQVLRVRVEAAGQPVSATRAYGPAEGVDVGTVGFILAGRRVLIAGERGVQLLVGERFQTLRSLDPDALRGVTGAAETPEGDLWLNSLRGAVLVRAQALQAVIQDPQQPLSLRVFDTLDGYPGSATPQGPSPSLTAQGDGRLWFAGMTGVAWLDTRKLPPEPAPPRALVRLLRVDEQDLAPPGNDAQGRPGRLVLLPGTRRVDLHYTALALALPERARFQVRLDGVDSDWRDVGARREAAYSNLGPGHYAFRVRAAVGQGDWGEWGEAAAPLHFSIRPTPTQTLWFKLLAGALALGALALAYRLRMRQAADRLHEKLRERVAERERIARELHDTLLQGVHGLTLRFQKVANRMGDADPNRALMEQALERADRLIIEGRDRVLDLRSHEPAGEGGHASLPAVLSDLGEQLAAEQDVQFLVNVQGRPRELRPGVQEELVLIGKEAIHNAFQHARAGAIRVDLAYRWHGLRLEISDDGQGMDSRLMREGRMGHWGLTGMRERARALSARFSLRAQAPPARGTRVQLSLSAPLAYARPWQLPDRRDDDHA